jgi:hypothetical protein
MLLKFIIASPLHNLSVRLLIRIGGAESQGIIRLTADPGFNGAICRRPRMAFNVRRKD